MNRHVAMGLLVAAMLAALPVAGQEQKGKKYALLVGVKEYQHAQLAPLRYSENDVVELAKVLRLGGYHITLLCDSEGKKDAGRQPTRANIEKSIKDMLRQTRREDAIFLAFAGHGLQFEGTKDCFFCPSDARPFADEAATLISLNQVYEELEKCFAGVKILVVDACRNDPKLEGKRGINADNAPRPPRGVAAFFSCSAGESAREHPKYQHGVFFHFLLEGLRGKAKNGNGNVTFNSLADYVAGQVAEEVPNLIGDGAKQSPNQKADLSGASPVLVAALADPREGPFGKEHANSMNMKFMYVPAGTFTMGAPKNEPGRDTDEDEHEVQITTGFYLGKFEVTIGQFAAFVRDRGYKTEAEKDGRGGAGFNPQTGQPEGRNPRFNWQYQGWERTEQHPVANISWNDAVAFCRWLSGQEKKNYRLPTEAEWEYACRAGSRTAFHHGDDPEAITKVANVWDASFETAFPKVRSPIRSRDGYVFTAPVGQFAANAFGLHDMHGNVWELCQDWYDAKYDEGPTKDPSGPQEGKKRVMRGGGFSDIPIHNRSAYRFSSAPGDFKMNVGFRVVLEAPRKK